MKLRELEPVFVRREVRPCRVGTPGCSTVSEHDRHEWRLPVDTIDEADGVMFLCPKCYLAHGASAVGTHSVLIAGVRACLPRSIRS